MNQLKQILFAVLVALVSSVTANAYDFEVDGIYYKVLSQDGLTCEVSKGDKSDDQYSGDIVIPTTVTYNGKTYSVTEIGMDAFYHCTNLTSVVIGNSVTIINSDSFEQCTNLSSVKFGNSLTTIKNAAFSGCSKLTSVEFPNSLTLIGIASFSYCKKLASVTIGNSVTVIADKAFQNCTSLKEINSLAVNPPRIGDDTFEGVSKKEAIVKVPEKSVADYKEADYWKDFCNIMGQNSGSGGEPEVKQCEAPEIALTGGKIVAMPKTKGSRCHTSITSDDFKVIDGNEPIELSGVYKIMSYAYADSYQDSETVTAYLVWVNPTIKDADNVIAMEARKAVVIRSEGNGLMISGTEQGEKVEVFSLDGMKLNSSVASDCETTFPCHAQKGEIVIVKYGEKAVKVKL